MNGPLTLAEVRRSQGVTQVELAASLGHHRQSQVSRTERQSDLLASTLRSYVEALGGRLELVAEFPDEATFVLTPFSSPAHNDSSPDTTNAP